MKITNISRVPRDADTNILGNLVQATLETGEKVTLCEDDLLRNVKTLELNEEFADRIRKYLADKKDAEAALNEDS